jgi:hypothetical protein
MTLTEKDPLEVIPITFEFKNLTSSPLVPSISVIQTAGPADSGVSSMKVGSAVVVGTQVLQRIGGGVTGCNYELQCQVDTVEGYRYVLAGILPVRDQ